MGDLLKRLGGWTPAKAEIERPRTPAPLRLGMSFSEHGLVVSEFLSRCRMSADGRTISYYAR